MREIITIQVGECGNRVGTRFWEELCREHCLDERSGRRLPDESCKDSRNLERGNIVENMNAFFDEDKDGGFLPRVVMADLDSYAIDSVFSGSSGKLFRNEYSTSGYCGTGGNCAKGKGEGREILEIIDDCIRKSVEACDCVQGFQVFHSIGGGTGSGLGSLINSSIRSTYPDRILSTTTVIPTVKSMDGILSPYNAILSMENLVENVDMVKCVDNQALFNLGRSKMGLENATMDDLNGIIAQSTCGETCSFRFSGFMNSDMRKLATNLVVFPRIHFFISSLAPLGKSFQGEDNTDLSLEHVMRQLFSSSNFLASVDPRRGRYYTASAMFRGDMSTYYGEEQTNKMTTYQSSYFCEWIPNNIQSSFCKLPPPGIKRSASLLASSSCIHEYFKDLSDEFSKLFRRKAFVNWYTDEGMDEMEFVEAESNVNDLISEYIPFNSYYMSDEEEEEPQPDEQSY